MTTRTLWIVAGVAAIAAIALWRDPAPAAESDNGRAAERHTREAVHRLERQVAALRGRLATVDTAREGPIEHAPEADGEDEADDAADDAADMPDRPPVGSAEHSAVIAADLDHHLAAEPHAPSWAAEVRAQVAEALAAPSLRGAILRDLECRTSLCRLEASWDDHDALEEATGAIPTQPPFDTHGFIHVSEDAPGVAVVYFARRGDALPL